MRKKWTWKIRDNEVRIFNSSGTPMVHFTADDLPSLVKYLSVVMQMNEERRLEIDSLRKKIYNLRYDVLEEAARIAESSNGTGKEIAGKIRGTACLGQ